MIVLIMQVCFRWLTLQSTCGEDFAVKPRVKEEFNATQSDRLYGTILSS